VASPAPAAVVEEDNRVVEGDILLAAADNLAEEDKLLAEGDNLAVAMGTLLVVAVDKQAAVLLAEADNLAEEDILLVEADNLVEEDKQFAEEDKILVVADKLLVVVDNLAEGLGSVDTAVRIERHGPDPVEVVPAIREVDFEYKAVDRWDSGCSFADTRILLFSDDAILILRSQLSNDRTLNCPGTSNIMTDYIDRSCQ
jgi:hypothetical protein